MKTPASLLQRLRQATNQEAWARLVQLYLPLICYWARRAGLQDADVADLSQEVFTVLFRVLPDFNYDKHKSFRAWLRTLTLNKWREMRRRAGLPLLGDDFALGELAAADGSNLWEDEHTAYLSSRALHLMRTDFDVSTWQACWDTVIDETPAAVVGAKVTVTTQVAPTARVAGATGQVLVWVKGPLIVMPETFSGAAPLLVMVTVPG